MKLNRNFVQISATALITSAAFIVLMANSGTGLFTNSPKPSIRLDNWNQAERMHEQYLEFRPLRVEDPENENHADKDDLKGFIFEAEHLIEILEDNRSGKTPNKVYFMFGQDGRFGDGFLHNSAHMRMIAVGMLDEELLNYADSGTEISVFDKADPCPPNCPD